MQGPTSRTGAGRTRAGLLFVALTTVVTVLTVGLSAITAADRAQAQVQARVQAQNVTGDRAGFSPGAPFLWDSDAELDRDLDAMAATGARWIRIDFDWPSAQPTPTTFHWDHIDRVVSAARARGLEVLALPGYTPAWARPAGTTDKFPPTNPIHFATFVGAAAARYTNQGVTHWEIWNEPNIKSFWQPSPDVAAYTRLLVAASAAIKLVDPTATVMTGGTSPALDQDGGIAPLTFLRGVYDNGGGGAFDAAAHHPYHFPYAIDAPGDWNAWAAVTPALRQLMVDQGDATKPIWLTEYGAPTGTSSQAVSEAAQAALVTRAFEELEDWPWAGPLFWYAFRDQGSNTADRGDNFGLVRRDFEPKPALSAFTATMG